MTHVEYWQRLNEIKLLTRELGEAWARFDDGVKTIRAQLVRSQEIVQGQGWCRQMPVPDVSESAFPKGK